jgi:hypothetical protein
MNPLDQLFQQKLNRVEVAPSAEVWNRIEANLVKKNKGLIWFRSAAVVGFLFSLTGMWWYVTNEAAPQPAVTQQVTPPPATPIETAPPPIVPDEPEPTATQHTHNSATSVKQALPLLASQTESPVEATAQHEVVMMGTTEEEVTLAELQAPTEVTVIERETAPLVVEYTLPVLVSEAEPEPLPETPETGIEKIRNAALELKHSEGWWRNLRMAKDDLLALDFKKDKNKKLE